MIETREIRIPGQEGGERVFRVSQLPATKATKLFTKLLRVLGPAFGSVLENVDVAKGTMSEVRPEALGAAAANLFDRLTEAEWDEICTRLFEGGVVLVDGDKAARISYGMVDSVFGGDISGFLRLIAFCLEVNYQRFLGGPLAALRRMVEARASATSRPTSSGPSGGSS